MSAFLKGKNNTRNENMYEIVRHSTKGVVIDSLSKVIKKFQRNFTESLYIYCDNSFFNTEFYIKVGFKRIEDIPPDYKYVINSKRENKLKWKKTDIKSAYASDIRTASRFTSEHLAEVDSYALPICFRTF